MRNPRRLTEIVARVRVVVYVVLVLMVGWGVWRYDIVLLPEAGCSPLVGFEAGDRLVMDQHPGAIQLGDAVLFRNPAGELLLGRVASPPPSAPEQDWADCEVGMLWIVSERDGCPQADSTRHGPIDPAQVTGRVAAGLPW